MEEDFEVAMSCKKNISLLEKESLLPAETINQMLSRRPILTLQEIYELLVETSPSFA